MRGAPLLAALLACVGALTGCGRPEAPPNIVLVVLDTVRADRVSCYGYSRETTPHLDALCARGIRFDDASSSSSWTLPAHATLFTGRAPIEHGATQEHTKLGAELPTLAELLAKRGYATFGTSANPMVSVHSGLARGFDVFEETWRGPERPKGTPAEGHENLVAVRNFLEGLPPSRPFFVFVNYIEAHGPYEPPEPLRSRFLSDPVDPSLARSAQRREATGFYLDPQSIPPREFAVVSDLYDGEVARVDELLGALVAFLEDSGRLANTVLVVTSDHGENLGDHGHFRHMFSLYRSTVRIPLIVRLPGDRRAGEVRSEPVALADLFPTLLHLADAGVDGAAGHDLLDDPGDAAERAVFAEYYYPLQALRSFGDAAREGATLAPHRRRIRSVEQSGLRFLWSSDGAHELFDLAEDPHEGKSLLGEPRLAERQRRLEAALDAYVARAGGPQPLPDAAAQRDGGAFGELDPESAERLRELGYLP